MSDLRAQLAVVRDVIAPRRMCKKKTRYIDERSAGRVRYSRQKRESSTLYVYQCPACKGWHLTKMSQPEARA